MPTLREQLGRSVALLTDDDTGHILGSGFAVARDGLLLTAFHVVGDPESGRLHHETVAVEFPSLGVRSYAVVARDWSSPSDDFAILRLASPLPEAVSVFSLDTRLVEGASFVSFGFRKPAEFVGLFAEGQLISLIEVRTPAGGTRMALQLRSTDIGRGMSGAPVVESDYGRVVGVIASYWHEQTAHDADLALAVPMQTVVAHVPALAPLVPGLLARPRQVGTGHPLSPIAGPSPRLAEQRDAIVAAFCAAVVLLLAEQHDDGSWARTLWRWTGSEFTQDVADASAVGQARTKKAISVTSWAAQALFKATGSNTSRAIRLARGWTRAHWNDSHGAFGFLYGAQSSTPLADGSAFVPNPRHTASAAKMLEMCEGLSDIVLRSTEFLVRSEQRGGGWGETPYGQANSLATAYVLDTLVKFAESGSLPRLLPEMARRSLRPVISRGFAWLAQAQHDDGFWEYSGHQSLKPFYTANILACAPQLAQAHRDVVERAIERLLDLRLGSGIPIRLTGAPEITPTAMLAYALSKVDPLQYHQVIESLVTSVVDAFLLSVAKAESHIFDSIFVVQCMQLPSIDREWWAADVDAVYANAESILDDRTLDEHRRTAALGELVLSHGVSILPAVRAARGGTDIETGQ
jgi:hypothetical protein